MSALQMIEELLLIYFGNIHWIGVEANFPGIGAEKKPTNLIKQSLNFSRPTHNTTSNRYTLFLPLITKVPDLF